MPHSEDDEDYGDLDDSAFVQAATQTATVDNSEDDFEPSPRPAKRRRTTATQSGVTANGRNRRPRARAGNQDRARRRTIVSDNGDTSDSAPFATTTKSGEDSLDEEDAFEPAPPAAGIRAASRPARKHRKNNMEDNSESASPTKKAATKPKHRVHIAQTADLKGAFFTQAPPPSSCPWMIRGPIWQKKPPTLPDKTSTVGVSLKNLGKSVVQSLPSSDEDEAFDPPLFPVQEDGANNGRNSTPDVAPNRVPIQPTGTVYDAAQELADLPSDAFASSSSLSPEEAADRVTYVSSQSAASPARQRNLAAPLNGLRQTTLFGMNAVQPAPPSQANKRHNWPLAESVEPPTHHKLDPEAMQTYVYPTNLGSTRDYQFNIVARGLFHNLLVALPTGLGKTFIAATIMLNWFRWTKDAQIVFVAPTKPLVAQQVEACFNIAGIPRSQTTMLTGEIPPGLRAEEWNDKRVFFMTPQTFINDLKTGICDPKKIVLLVVDEAHKATGNYAYVEVVKFIRRFNQSFRVLALTATPGADVEAVQKVIDGLDISRVEIRTEQSLDIRQYVHTRKTVKEVFDYTPEMEMVMDLYSKAVQPVLNILTGQNAYWVKDPVSLTPFGLTKARQQWMASDAGRRANFGLKAMVNSVFTILASLSHGMDLLKNHGIGPFYHGMLKFRNEVEEGGGKSKYRTQINGSVPFQTMMNRLRAWINDPEFVGHPKLDRVREVVLNHFLDAGEGRRADGAPPSSTRIMIFAHWRASAEEIVRILERHKPMIRPHVFVGQASSGDSEGMDQKRQLDIIQKFKIGVYNTLVATSIGEEGLDIGEVDLIICYDSKASPIRMLQRMGRTGRKRAGQILLLQMRGKEEDDAIRAQDNYEKMQAMIASGTRFAFHDDRSRRIVPKDIQPVVDKRVVDIPLENTQAGLPEPKRRGGRAPKRPPKKFHMPDGVRTGFIKASRMGEDGEELSGDEEPQPRRQKNKPESELETVAIPPLSEAFLSNADRIDLERNYQHVYDGEESQTVSAPRLDAYPHRQRTPSRTKRVPHGQRTLAAIEALKKMHAVNDARLAELQRNLQHPDIPLDDAPDLVSDPPSDSPEDDRTADAAPPRPPRSKKPRAHARRAARASRAADSLMAAEAEDASSPPPSDPYMRIRSQAITLGSQDTDDDDDGAAGDGRRYGDEEEQLDSDLADFIADDAEPVDVFSSSLPEASVVQRRAGRNGVGGSSRPFYTEREVQMGGTQEDDELPEISMLVAGKGRVDRGDARDGEGGGGAGIVVRKRRRRVVDEDEHSSE